MSGFIEALYYGDINLRGVQEKPNPVLDAIEKKMSELENKLRDNLQGEDEEIFNKYTKASEYRTEVIKAKVYKQGFRDGSQFTYDAFNNE